MWPTWLLTARSVYVPTNLVPVPRFSFPLSTWESGWCIKILCMHASIGAATRRSAYYGMGIGPILLSNLYCTGSEDTLLGCNRNMYGALSCTHRQDAGVVCEGKW